MDQVRRLLAPLFHDLDRDGLGWATRSVISSIRSTVYTLVAAWQLVLAAAAFQSLGHLAWPLAVIHLAFAAYVLYSASSSSTAALAVIPVTMTLLSLAEFTLSRDIDSVLVVAALWQLNFGAGVVGLTFLSRRAVPFALLGAILVGSFVWFVLPEWGAGVPAANVVALTGIVIGIRLGLPAVLAVGRGAETENARAEELARRRELQHQVSQKVAEEARVLHDSAINTLAVIANGKAGLTDTAWVRAQCAEDADVLRALRESQESVHEANNELASALSSSLLPVDRTGLSDQEFSEKSRGLEPSVVSGALSTLREALTNAAKHSRAESVGVAITSEASELVIEIRDSGVGFDVASQAGLGLEQSVIARAYDLGFTATITSTRNHGTTVALRLPMSGPDTLTGEPPLVSIERPNSPETVVAEIQRRAGLLWGAGVTIVGVALTLTTLTTVHAEPLLLMLAVMSVSVAVSARHRSKAATWPLVWFLALSTGAVLLLSNAAHSFGSYNAFTGQALAATGPFIMLLAHRPTRSMVGVGLAVWLSAIGVAVLLGDSANASLVTLFLACVGLLFTFGWMRFMSAAALMTSTAANDAMRAFVSQLEYDGEQAAQQTYRRWLDAGLDRTIVLLSEIANGDRPVDDPTTHAACAEEESYLRQLVLISPELGHLGNALIPMLRDARELGVHLVLRLGGLDAPNEDSAASLVSGVSQALQAAGAGSTVTATFFPVDGGLQLTITGSRIEPADLATLPESFTAVVEERETLNITQIFCPIVHDRDGSTELVAEVQ